MGKMLIIRGATYTPSTPGGGTTGGGTTPTPPAPTLLSRLEPYFVNGKGFSGQSYADRTNRSVLKDVPVEEFFPSRSVTLTPTANAGFSVMWGTTNGLGNTIGTFAAWTTEETTITIPSAAVYISFAFHYNDDSATAGSLLSDFLANISS